MKTVAILQSSYIPWKGYFDMINMADEFVLYDSVQYTRRDWRNRNRIKTPRGVKWLTIPVRVRGKYRQRICDAVASNGTWPDKHWKTIAQTYARAEHFREFRPFFLALYRQCRERSLSRINATFITAICGLLGIRTRISFSMDHPVTGGRTERLVGICSRLGATRYLTGPAAKSYLDEAPFRERGIEVQYMDYSGYREYRQLHPPFVHNVSIIDLILNAGPRARDYMKSFQP